MYGFAIFLVIWSCYGLLIVDGLKYTRNLSREEDDEMEFKLKLLNKPSIKTMQDKSGDIYDCVDVNKQLAFDHPLLKNHAIDFPTISTSSYHKMSGQDYTTITKSFGTFVKVAMCPLGTVPVRRITKEDLIREKDDQQATKAKITNRPNTFLAVARTKFGRARYTGGVGYIKVENPKVVGQQYSSARVKVQAGLESIEAGWRVDPSLYGDSQTRFYIRTDAGNTHCFDTRCPAFIQGSAKFGPGSTFNRVSIPGGTHYVTHVFIIKNLTNGNWNLIAGHNADFIGYWPSHIFTKLSSLADRVEWGGAAYSPPGTPLPPMGSGNYPIGIPTWDGFVSNIKVLSEKGFPTEDRYIETFEDNSKFYSVRDEGYLDQYWEHIILYGGPGHI